MASLGAFKGLREGKMEGHMHVCAGKYLERETHTHKHMHTYRHTINKIIHSF